MYSKHENNRFKLSKRNIDTIVKDINEIMDLDITKRTRKRNVVEPRQILQGFLYYRTVLTSSYIAEYFEMNHASVLHSCKLYFDLQSYFKGKYKNLYRYLGQVELKYSDEYAKRSYYINSINATLENKSVKALRDINRILNV